MYFFHLIQDLIYCNYLCMCVLMSMIHRCNHKQWFKKEKAKLSKKQVTKEKYSKLFHSAAAKSSILIQFALSAFNTLFQYSSQLLFIQLQKKFSPMRTRLLECLNTFLWLNQWTNIYICCLSNIQERSSVLVKLVLQIVSANNKAVYRCGLLFFLGI